ncbi:hypothetical protein [Pectobacterium brasiliense]|uniref:hypothetical protein n=1 Tax=Pectobacterium brasiliense TaxID=180957 RepID=UPI0019691FE6|nr:hypothetical protein [Pectobacterium brasiliense]MBN3263016.1 hypothetical protein [Pectobacterium brasiliense]
MVKFKIIIEGFINRVLSAQGYSQKDQPAIVKKIGRGFLLLSALIIVPLLIWELPLIVQIGIQLLFAAGMFIGSLLAFDEEK